MDNRVFYGQYSLRHWLDLLLKGNIILPDYQRFFVWDETKVIKLIDTFRNKEFVPPITIGAFYENGVSKNLILDGQQRLTSILLAYLGLYPDVKIFKATLVQMASENDDDIDEEDQLDNVLAWDFSKLIEKGKTKEEIIDKIVPGNYKHVNFVIDETFLKQTFLGFSYLVPDTQDLQVQQKYYSSVFRNINIQGETLLPLESRASLYFLNRERKDFFDPPFMDVYTLKKSKNEDKIDFVRIMALLTQYAVNNKSDNIARGFRPKMEKYYEEYIYTVVGEQSSLLFKKFTDIFPQGIYSERFDRLRLALDDLDIPKHFNSIIEADIYLFGLIYCVLFNNKVINIEKKDDLIGELQDAMDYFKNDSPHKRSPGALKYLRERMDRSIEIYENYVNE